MGAGCCKEEEIDFNAEVELLHFHLLRSVGKGAFGKVRVVQHKNSKILYALKYINKEKCIKMRAIENIIQERRLLEEIEHSLICNLRYAFQDDDNMFMVLDLMLGGDLRFHLERQGNMREEVVKFYIAEISLGLDYLHSKKIVHRDLKPDNVLLDEKGHAHLTDFNIAVHYNEKKPLTSIAGSMAYMAPEILKKRGYFNSVDWWSLGVVMYELLFSKRPFKGKTNQNLTQAILHEPLRFPEHTKEHISDDCLDVLKRFCERDINKRLGCNGIDEIKQHPWFSNIEWDKLCTKEADPPFVPDSKRANFDATHELEELLLEDNPLKAKKRANPNQVLSELSKEVRMMEEKFLIYDFSKMSRKSYYNYLPENMNAQHISKQNSISNDSSTTMLNTDNRSLSTMISSHERQESDVTAVTSTEYKTKNEIQIKPNFENNKISGLGGTNAFSDHNGNSNKNNHRKNMSYNNNGKECYTLKPSSSAQDINKQGVSMTLLSATHTKSSSLTLPSINYNNNNNNNNRINIINYNYNNNNDNNNNYYNNNYYNNNNNSYNKKSQLIPLQLLSTTTANTSQLLPSQLIKNSPNDPLGQRSNSSSSSRSQSPSTSPSTSPSSSSPSPLPSPQILPNKYPSKSLLNKSFIESQNNINISSPPPLPPPNSPLPLPPMTLQQQKLFYQNISSHAVNNNNNNNNTYPKIHYRDESDIIVLPKNQHY